MSEAPPYRWLQRLGRGSSGEVWAVEREGRELAVKVFRVASERSPLLEAIRRETRIGALIEGLPGVVAIERSLFVEGQLFLEMPWVRGPNLEQVLRGRLQAGRGPIPPRVAVTWAIEMLRALDAVSRRVSPERPLAFVHRDIKPANVLLRPSGQICITDFGVARASARMEFETTATGVVKGSPRFMAPEAVRGEVVDARADQFAVGAVLYELLTGRPLYDAPDLVGVVTQVIAANVEEALGAVDDRSNLRAVLRTMLARKADRRFPDNRAAAVALSSVQVGGPGVHDLLPELLELAHQPDEVTASHAPSAAATTLNLEAAWLVAQQADEDPTYVLEADPDDEPTEIRQRPPRDE